MLNNTNRSNDFIVGNCPSCDKYVRVPVDTNPMSTVKCPMCEASFELALMIEGVVPSVQVVDDNMPAAAEPPENTLSRKSVNAIDTPEIFHVKSKQDYTPITEKKNGKFVVPEQLAKGVKKKKKRRRRRSSSSDSDRSRSSVSPTSPVTESPVDPIELSEKMAENIAGSKDTSAATPVETYSAGVPDSSIHEAANSVAAGSIAVEESSSSEHVGERSEGQSSEEGSSKKRSGNPTRRRPRHNSKSRKSNQKHTSSKLPMVLFGIFFVLPLLQLMMWWIVGIDPLGIAPAIGRVVPIVPSSLLDEESAEDEAAIAEQQKPKKKSHNILDPNIPHKLPTPNLDPDSIYIDDDK